MMTPSIKLEALVGERQDMIDCYWDFLWKLGYWPYAYDRQKLVTLGDIAVGIDAADALHASRLFDVPARIVIRCIIPMVERAVATSCFAAQYKDRLQAMDECLAALKPFSCRKIDRPTADESDHLPGLIFTELVRATMRADECTSDIAAVSLARAATWSVWAVAQSEAVDDEDDLELRRVERQKQTDDLLRCFPAAHSWGAVSNPSEVRFRRSRCTPWPITGDIFHDPVAWPIEEA